MARLEAPGPGRDNRVYFGPNSDLTHSAIVLQEWASFSNPTSSSRIRPTMRRWDDAQLTLNFLDSSGMLSALMYCAFFTMMFLAKLNSFIFTFAYACTFSGTPPKTSRRPTE
ncbi:hypothetical protein CVT26_003320 [Gymnopilus dilepis]|uniref:Uncharacterized protein n=1 Tax=Gymnopilus dilepis TaxID=231916 RepID=A0A409W2P1_9AGAR|nr:hypothetical protein CVT26_003320 [Gymnopilus dilepis]